MTQGHRRELLDHAERQSPNESCALLFGKVRGGSARVARVFLTRNTEESPTMFAMAGDEIIAGYKTAEAAGMEVVGIFHSHPSSDAYPSETDRRFMLVNPVVWVIASGATELRAFTLDSEISEIPVSLDA